MGRSTPCCELFGRVLQTLPTLLRIPEVQCGGGARTPERRQVQRYHTAVRSGGHGVRSAFCSAHPVS
ncbi:hypothetical protein AB1Y20_004533 [Prymnesium parvum]|uniref:Uncharacterized protein n=1 Tax=Prymnesium parvum TaxID=97485 RepID=A0AB34IWQ7_PRYPA